MQLPQTMIRVCEMEETVIIGTTNSWSLPRVTRHSDTIIGASRARNVSSRARARGGLSTARTLNIAHTIYAAFLIAVLAKLITAQSIPVHQAHPSLIQTVKPEAPGGRGVSSRACSAMISNGQCFSLRLTFTNHLLYNL